MSRMSRSTRIDWSTGGGLAAIVLWSMTFAVARSLSERIGPLTAGACVYLLGGVLHLLWLMRQGTAVRQVLSLSRRYVWGCGFLFVFYTVVTYVAIGSAADRRQVLEIGLINYLWPTATILLSLVVLNKHANLLLLPGTALALAGEFLALTQGAQVSWSSFRGHLQTNPVAYACALAGALAWALYSTLARRWSRPGGGGAVALFLPATGLALLILRLFSAEPSAWSGRAAGEAVVLAVGTVLGYGLWDMAMRQGNLLFVAACSYFTPLLSTFVSCLYLRVTPGWRLWVGCLALVGGSLLTWLSLSDRPAKSTRALRPDAA
ncbi:MAG: aromatic amino acid DMT transporter YddG [Planctomycetes bacterium]|nr:aromatic amino acid DMT transporter YddG [Planctomycetota bacterium]